ncbi:MAG: DUF362 domain-containing protein, partial [Candidatus Margulisiibacteriota bacterium]
KPERVKPIIKKIKDCGGIPFLTDSNTIYKGSRSDAVSHLQTAFDHGFTFGKIGAPVIIADGLQGHSYKKVEVNLKHFKEVYLSSIVLEIDVLIVISHFKGHELTGFGGAIKNVGMGLGCRAGKQQMHAEVRPQVKEENCTGCGCCVIHCPTNAIALTPSQKAWIDLNKCIGCAECIASCRYNALAVSWAGSSDSLQEKMVEYMAGVLKVLKGKVGYINFITDVSPNCDCYDFNDPPIVPDLGILASFDPVALDQACVDLVNKSSGRINASDKFKALWPGVNWETQLIYAEQIGLGKRNYELTNL